MAKRRQQPAATDTEGLRPTARRDTAGSVVVARNSTRTPGICICGNVESMEKLVSYLPMTKPADGFTHIKLTTCCCTKCSQHRVDRQYTDHAPPDPEDDPDFDLDT